MGWIKINKILMFGHAGSSNHGCEAIVRSTVKILKSSGLDIHTILGTYRVNEDKRFGLDLIIDEYANHRQVNRHSFGYVKNVIARALFGIDRNIEYVNREITDKADESTVAISIGGDNYCYGDPSGWMYLNRACKERNARTVLWGCSIEPALLKNKAVVEDMKRYDLITPRESITHGALINAGITGNTLLFPDQAFVLEKTDLPLPEGFIENNTVGINLSPLIIRREEKKGITFKNYLMLIRYIIEKTDMNIALIPHVAWDNKIDLEPLSGLYESFSSTGRAVLLNASFNCMELKGFISRCRFFVGARTHSVIAAYSSCVPALTMGYSVKARGIARDIFGSEEKMVLPVQSLEKEDDLLNSFMYILENETPIRKHLKDFMPSYTAMALQAGCEVKKIIPEMP